MREPALDDPFAVAVAADADARRAEQRGGELGRRFVHEPAGQRLARARLGRLAAILDAKAFAITENCALAAEWRRRLAQQLGKPRMDEIVPAIGRPAFGGLIAGDDEALSRAGHGDVEQAPMLAGLSLARLRPRGRDRVGVLV